MHPLLKDWSEARPRRSLNSKIATLMELKKPRHPKNWVSQLKVQSTNLIKDQGDVPSLVITYSKITALTVRSVACYVLERIMEISFRMKKIFL
jgi:hypothetical protein